MRWVLNNIDATQKQYISWFWQFQDYNDRALSTWIQYIPIYMNIVRLTAEQRWFSRLPRWYYYQHRVNAMLNIKTSINTAIHEMTVAMPFGIDDSTTTYMISRTVSIIYDITTIYIWYHDQPVRCYSPSTEYNEPELSDLFRLLHTQLLWLQLTTTAKRCHFLRKLIDVFTLFKTTNSRSPSSRPS